MLNSLEIAGCSGSDDGTSPTTEASAESTEATPDTTEATPETTEAGLNGEGLEIGLLAPSRGLLSALSQGQDRGTVFAATDVDDGGGVLDGPLIVTNYPAEPGGEPSDNVKAAVDGGAQALIGPAGSDNAVEVRDEVASLGSITCSASATLPRITLDQEVMALEANPDHSDYVRLLEGASFPDDFDRLQKYTVFAPTNQAFVDAGYDIDAMLASQDPAELFALLQETVALGVLDRASLVDGSTIEMLSGNSFPVTNDGTTITIDGLAVPPPPTLASNGIIHTLGALPPA